MTPRIIDVPQRSPEWFAARAGRLTGSSAGAMLAKIKTGESAQRRDLRLRLICERLTGQPQEDTYINEAMQRGIDCEPLAFAAYEALTGHLTRRTGFLQHPDLLAGCSLDGDVNNLEGILECKCPKSATHLEYLTTNAIPDRHLPQLLHNLWISGAAWCDFVSFDDRFGPELAVFYQRITRESVAADLVAYELAARLFLTEVERGVESVRALRAQTAVA